MAELMSGLSNAVSIPAGTGMLFDMGYDQDAINISMADMLFSLDIAFINSEHGVVGVLRDVEPGESAAFDAGNGLGARYFLEANAGEMSNVNIGDNVSISGETQPAFWAGLVAAVMAISQIAIVGASTYRVVKEEWVKGKEAGHHSSGNPGITTICPICKKVIEVPEYNKVTRSEALKQHIEEEHPLRHHSIHGPERDRLVRIYGSWAIGRAESVCPEDDVQCVEHEAAEFLAKFKAGRWP